MSYTGRVENGVVVLDHGAALPEGTLVRVEPQERSGSSDPLFDIGRRAVAIGQSDLATQLDHYLYGHPRVSDAGP